MSLERVQEVCVCVIVEGARGVCVCHCRGCKRCVCVSLERVQEVCVCVIGEGARGVCVCHCRGCKRCVCVSLESQVWQQKIRFACRTYSHQ